MSLFIEHILQLVINRDCNNADDVYYFLISWRMNAECFASLQVWLLWRVAIPIILILIAPFWCVFCIEASHIYCTPFEMLQTVAIFCERVQYIVEGRGRIARIKTLSKTCILKNWRRYSKHVLERRNGERLFWAINSSSFFFFVP